MHFSLSIRNCTSALAVLLAAGFGLATAQAGGVHGEKIEFSEPSAPIIASNLTEKVSPSLNRLNPAPNAFKQVQQDLFRPLINSMQTDNSMQGTLSGPSPQPQQRPAPDKRTRDLMDQRRNWAFSDLNDVATDSSLDDPLGMKESGTDGKAKKPVSLMEQYRDSTGTKGAKDRNQWMDGYNPKGSNALSANGYNMLTRSMNANENISRNLRVFSSGADEGQNDVVGAGGFKNPFSAGNGEDPALTKRRDEFRHLLDPSLPASKPVNSFGAANFDDFAHHAPASGGFNNQAGQPAAEPHRSSINPMLGLVDPTTAALHSRISDDPTARSLGMPNPEPFKVAPVPQTAKTSQKMLDPFAASIMKPKF